MLTAAFATADGIHVDAHFGWCPRFDIYDITAESVALRESRCVATDTLATDPVTTDPVTTDPVTRQNVDSEDDRVRARLDTLAGCALVCVASIGPGAAARVVNARVHPLKTDPGTTIASVLERLQAVLQGTPPPWLRKLQTHSP
jgi:nitrogen fixation protein NifX